MVGDITIGWLEGLTDNVKGKRVEIKGESFLIGRGPAAELQLNDPQVSRQHARIVYAHPKLTLEDLGSTHGTYLNGEQIKTAALKNGDRIRFGGSLFHLHLAKAVSESIQAGQDDIATVMASEDDVATALISPDDADTYLAGDHLVEASAAIDSHDMARERCAHCGAVLTEEEKYCGECGQPRAVEEPEATVIAANDAVPPAVEPPPVQAPSVTPPIGPQVSGTKSQMRFPQWLRIAGAGLAAVVVLGMGLLFAINRLGAQADSPGDIMEETSATEGGVEQGIEVFSTLTPEIIQSAEPTQGELPVVEEPSAATTAPQLAATQGQIEATPAPASSEAAGISAAVGGASGIAFASDRTGYPQLYYLDLTSREITQLTDMTNGACQPAWSPDGTHLAYTSPCGSNREAYTGSTIFILDVDQEGTPGIAQPLVLSVGGGDYDLDWSPDGSKLAFTSQRTGRPQIFTATSDGHNAFNVNDDLAHNWNPSWSPDGSRIAFLTGRGGAEEIWLVPSEGGEEQRFSRSDGKDVAKPDWSPDGANILFEKVVGSIPRIVAAPVSDSGVRVVQICQEGALSLQPMGEPAWSPDGKWVAFETWPGGGDHKIAIMQVSCTGYEELTDDPALDFDAAWRPVP